MEIYVRNIPPQSTNDQLRAVFEPPLRLLQITSFECQKTKGKGCALLFIDQQAKAQEFLDRFGSSLRFPGRRSPMICQKSTDQSGGLMLRSMIFEEQRLKNAQGSSTRVGPSQRSPQKIFGFEGLECVVWDYPQDRLTFVSHFRHACKGNVHFGKDTVVLLVDAEDDSDSKLQIHIPYHSIDSVVTGGYESPTLSFTLKHAPRIYRIEETIGDIDVNAMLARLQINSSVQVRPSSRSSLSTLGKKKITKIRVSSIRSGHEGTVGSCFVYQIMLRDLRMVSEVHQLLDRHRAMPSSIFRPTPSIMARTSQVEEVAQLVLSLSDGRAFGGLPFALRFQAQKLAMNGFLSPSKVQELLAAAVGMIQSLGEDPTAEAFRRLALQIPYAGPDVDAARFDTGAMQHLLHSNVVSYRDEGSAHEAIRKHPHLALIYRAMVTPGGIYLEGPEPEVTNRVLRTYRSHSDYFIRVVFADEDGDRVKYDQLISNDEIFWNKFRGILDGSINIAGRRYTFLGFSHSSLRSQACWFMAPFVHDGSLIHAQEVIKQLGDFSHIRSPARCAARIGQAFSDTTGSVTITPEQLNKISDIERNGRCFSDGVGTISNLLLQKIWRVYAPLRNPKPTCLQIRFAGAKGMVSLDTRLHGETLCIRGSMDKFPAPNHNEIEICHAAFRPLPMYLNRSLIKIVEDLGVPEDVLIRLQTSTVEKLRQTTLLPVNAANFLEWSHVGDGARVPSLIRRLNDIGLLFQEDEFLSDTVEMAAIVTLRDIKHRARIPVPQGVTLYGIMDETGYLKEGEVFCTTETEAAGNFVLECEKVLITRSPALHPGDVQIVRAVDVPSTSHLKALRNCVVFSQHGERDLPSCLSGGDLDGDLYQVIWDPSLVPKSTHTPADYPKQDPIDIKREIEKADITKFFIEFMENDRVGAISNWHMMLADRAETGVLDPGCIKLAEMASVAVDFAKTGIPVDMTGCPKFHKSFRPDFMANGPRVEVESRGALLFESDDDVEEDDLVKEYDLDSHKPRYYESEKVLGKLYRAIDEKRFFAEMHATSRSLISQASNSQTLMQRLWAYLRRETRLVQWEQYRDLARDIRDCYESNMLDTMVQYTMHPAYPLHELEVFSGPILGKSMGKQNKRVRELAKAMKERFERDVVYTVERMRQDDDGATEEALPRSLACFAITMEECGREYGRHGRLRSFQYVAASICLHELERFQGGVGPLRRI